MKERRHRDDHALPHSAGQLVGIGGEHGFGQAEPAQVLGDLAAQLCLMDAPMGFPNRLKELFVDSVHGIEHAHRGLRHIGDGVPP